MDVTGMILPQEGEIKEYKVISANSLTIDINSVNYDFAHWYNINYTIIPELSANSYSIELTLNKQERDESFSNYATTANNRSNKYLIGSFYNDVYNSLDSSSQDKIRYFINSLEAKAAGATGAESVESYYQNAASTLPVNAASYTTALAGATTFTESLQDNSLDDLNYLSDKQVSNKSAASKQAKLAHNAAIYVDIGFNYGRFDDTDTENKTDNIVGGATLGYKKAFNKSVLSVNLSPYYNSLQNDYYESDGIGTALSAKYLATIKNKFYYVFTGSFNIAEYDTDINDFNNNVKQANTTASEVKLKAELGYLKFNEKQKYMISLFYSPSFLRVAGYQEQGEGVLFNIDSTSYFANSFGIEGFYERKLADKLSLNINLGVAYDLIPEEETNMHFVLNGVSSNQSIDFIAHEQNGVNFYGSSGLSHKINEKINLDTSLYYNQKLGEMEYFNLGGNLTIKYLF